VKPYYVVGKTTMSRSEARLAVENQLSENLKLN